MANPFDDLIPETPHGSIVVGTPHAPKPDKPDKPNLPAGYEMGPDGLARRIPGLPPEKADKQYKALPEASITKLEEQVSALSAFERSLNNFNPDYAGFGAGMENTLQGFTGLGTKGQRDWWADFQTNDAALRHAISGASLTPSEQANFAKLTVSPSMSAEEIQRNIARRTELAREVLARRARAYKAGPYDPDQIAAVLGEYDPDLAKSSPVTGGGVGAFGGPDDPPTDKKMTPEQQAAYDALLSSKPTVEQLQAFGDKIGIRIENADKIVAAQSKGAGYVPGAGAQYSPSEQALRLKAATDKLEGRAGGSSLAVQGATLGLSDEASGVGNALWNAIESPFTDADFDPVGSYKTGKLVEQMRLDDARHDLGAMGTAAEVGGSLLSGNPASLARLPTLGGRIVQGMRGGAAGGALAGFGYGEGAEGSAFGAAGGAAGGAALGAAFPVVGSVVANRVNGLRNLFRSPGETASRKIAGAFDADSVTPAAAGAAMDAAQSRGVPAMLADQGENMRNLLASVTRQPGPSRTIGLEAVTQRQLGQADRISGAISRDLGATSNPHEVSQALQDQARTVSTPLYDAFRAAPGASSVKIDDLMTRPSFREGLKRARDLVAERGEDPTALGFDLDAAGDVVLTRVPSWQTLDYVKRGMDDVVYGTKNALTGRPELTNKTAGIERTRQMLVSRMDGVNPHYAEARAAYAGPTVAKEALEDGLKALRLGADDISEQVRRLTPFQMEHYRLGVRRAMSDLVQSKGDTADKITALIGSPKKRAALQRVFGGSEGFDNFLATLGDERAAQMTYNRAATGSPTALNNAVDLLTGDPGLAEDAMTAALRGAKDGMWSSIVNLLSRAREAEQFGAGRAGEDARESIAALLVQTDPAELRQVMREAGRAVARRRVQARRGNRVTVTASQRLGQAIGAGLGSTQEPQTQPR